MRREKKFLSFSLLFLPLFIGTIFLAYKFVVPVLIEQTIEGKLERGFGKKVCLGKVDFNLFQGIKLHHLLVLEAGKEGESFLRVEKLQIDYCLREVFDNFWEKGKNFQKWQLALKVTSPEIIFRGWRLENLDLPLWIENSQLFGEDFTGELYGGLLQGSFSLNLVPDQRDYQLKGILSGLDLNRLATELSPPGEQNIQGDLKANISLKGKMGNLKSLRGQGEISIVDGKLWDLPLLEGLVAILSVSPLERLAFWEGRMSFTISEGLVASEDLTLTSAQVNLSGRGKMDFQGYFRPSLIYKISFPRGFLAEVPFIGNIIATFLDEAGYLMAQVEVTGSLKEPQSRLIPLAKRLRDVLRTFSAPLQDDD